jgi:hypothetical protein
MSSHHNDSMARSATEDSWAWERGSDEVAAQVRTQEAADHQRERELAGKARHLATGNGEVQRGELARRLGIPVETVRPCIAVMVYAGRAEETREQGAKIIAADLVKLRVAEDAARGVLGLYVSQCEQVTASHRFTDREANAWLRHYQQQQAAGRRIYGFGCKRRSILLEHCPYGAPEGRHLCPSVRGLYRVPKRESLATATGMWHAAQGHVIPEGWTRLEACRRRLLWLELGVLENLRGHGGEAYIGSLRELKEMALVRTSRETLGSDLRAMAAAAPPWIVYEPGRSWRGNAGLPRRGCRIIRLLPGTTRAPDSQAFRDTLGAVLSEFPDAEVVG